LAVLKAAKVDQGEQQSGESEKLKNAKVGGDLWRIKKDLVRVFEICEERFHYKSQRFRTSFIADDIVVDVRKNFIVKGNFRSLCERVFVKV